MYRTLRDFNGVMMSDKQQLRNNIRQRRKLITVDEQERAKQLLLNNLMPLLEQCKGIAIYDAAYGEADLELVIKYCLGNNIQVYAPIAYTNTKKMRFERIYNCGKREIFYPEDYELVNERKWYNLDLILLPLLAADQFGGRVGQGGGYYDATCSESIDDTQTILCGVGYQWQLFNRIPTDDWDLKLDFFVSEQELCKIIK